MAKVIFNNVNKIYPNRIQAVFDFNLEVEDKEFVVLVGPSGCGKSTTLRMLAGLETITSGEIMIDGVVVNDVEPKSRDIAMVFQSYALYPHLSVYENMAFSLKLRKAYFPIFDGNGNQILDNDFEKIAQLEDQIRELESENQDENQSQIRELLSQIESEKQKFDTPQTEYRHYTKEEIDNRIKEAAEILGLGPYLKRKPKALSGGQRQRVALGRAIVRTPKVFLMDEPLSNLDAKLRVAMRSEIAKIHQRVGATTIYVTHDQTEAMTMANRIVVMKDGYIQQIGTPKEIYNQPRNMFVADFVGAPAMNFLRGKISNDCFVVNNGTGILSFKLDDIHRKLVKPYDGKDLILGIRPEDFSIDSDGEEGARLMEHFPMECDVSELLGHELVVYGYLDNQRLVVKTKASKEIEVGDVHQYSFDENKIHFFDPETAMRLE